MRGYRPAPLGFWQSVLGVFGIHNETVNIWTHFAGLLVMLYVTPDVASRVFKDGTTADVFVFAFFTLACYLCMVRAWRVCLCLCVLVAGPPFLSPPDRFQPSVP